MLHRLCYEEGPRTQELFPVEGKKFLRYVFESCRVKGTWMGEISRYVSCKSSTSKRPKPSDAPKIRTPTPMLWHPDPQYAEKEARARYAEVLIKR